jgi:hypothetical protein
LPVLFILFVLFGFGFGFGFGCLVRVRRGV